MFTGICAAGCKNGHIFSVKVKDDMIIKIRGKIEDKIEDIVEGDIFGGLKCPVCNNNLHYDTTHYSIREI